MHIDIRPKLITKLVLSFKTKLEHKHRLNRHPKGVYYVSGLYSVGAILSSYYTVLILYTLILYTIYVEPLRCQVRDPVSYAGCLAFEPSACDNWSCRISHHHRSVFLLINPPR